MDSNRQESSAAPSLDLEYASTLVPSGILESDQSTTLYSNHSSLRLPRLPSILAEASGSNPSLATHDTHIAWSSPLDPESLPELYPFLTEEFGHPPYEQFTDRVHALLKSLEPLHLWTKISKRASLLTGRLGRLVRSTKVLGPAFLKKVLKTPKYDLEQMRGGSFNRVIGINFSETDKTFSGTDRNFVLRIPRDEEFSRPDRDVATLEYLRTLSSIPVPEVIHKDFTKNNPLGFSYMIQKKIPGQNLAGLWGDLNVDQRCCVARDVAKTLRELQSLQSKIPGIIEQYKPVGKDACIVETVPYNMEDNDRIVEAPDMEPVLAGDKELTLEFFLHHIFRWKALELAKPREEQCFRDFHTWDVLAELVVEMHDHGMFREKTYSFCHLDFQRRNIMAEVIDEKTVKVTGYLDWDSAVFAPSAVGCVPPFWLWIDGVTAIAEENERGRNCKPTDPVNLKVKQTFEEEVGPDFLYFAYQPQFRLVRNLFRVVKDGIQSDGRRIIDAMDFINDWSKLRKLLNPTPAELVADW